jgi:peptidoglycan/xylan/chitin deacetylase (PgdA/CDA1 family)
VTGFAYPNGQPDDFDETARDAVTAAGVPLAFTLVPGPARPAEIAADPLAIRRVYVHHGDDPTRFAAKVAGVPRLVGRS